MNEDFFYALIDEVENADSANDLVEKIGGDLLAIQTATAVFISKRVEAMTKDGRHERVMSFECGSNGVQVEIRHTTYFGRCGGDDNYEEHEYTVPYDVFFGEQCIIAWRDEIDRTRDEKRRRETEIREARIRAEEASRVEARERAALAALLRKYGEPQSG